MPIKAVYIDTTPQLLAGRVGIVMGLFAFAGVYIVILVQFGWIAGIAIGWLPSALVGWLTARGCNALVSGLLRGSSMPHSASSPKT